MGWLPIWLLCWQSACMCIRIVFRCVQIARLLSLLFVIYELIAIRFYQTIKHIHMLTTINVLNHLADIQRNEKTEIKLFKPLRKCQEWNEFINGWHILYCLYNTHTNAHTNTHKIYNIYKKPSLLCSHIIKSYNVWMHKRATNDEFIYWIE